MSRSAVACSASLSGAPLFSVTIAGSGHLRLGNVDYGVLISLLIRSAHGIWFGTSVGCRLPTVFLRKILVGVLFVIGLFVSDASLLEHLKRLANGQTILRRSPEKIRSE